VVLIGCGTTPQIMEEQKVVNNIDTKIEPVKIVPQTLSVKEYKDRISGYRETVNNELSSSSSIIRKYRYGDIGIEKLHEDYVLVYERLDMISNKIDGLNVPIECIGVQEHSLKYVTAIKIAINESMDLELTKSIKYLDEASNELNYIEIEMVECK